MAFSSGFVWKDAAVFAEMDLYHIIPCYVVQLSINHTVHVGKNDVESGPCYFLLLSWYCVWCVHVGPFSMDRGGALKRHAHHAKSPILFMSSCNNILFLLQDGGCRSFCICAFGMVCRLLQKKRAVIMMSNPEAGKMP